jgi:hypothetical protein
MRPSVIIQPGSDSRGERRSGPDRRKKGSSSLLAPFIHARRSHIRRKSDHRAFTLLDRYENLRLSAIALVLLLSMVDAFMTLFLIEHGAAEANPIMAYYLKQGPLAFVLTKYMLTAASVFLVVALHGVLASYQQAVIRNLIKVFAGAFMAVISWQLYLTLRYVIQ